MFEESGKFWFCTANTKKVFNQLKSNPNVEFSATSNSMQTVRLSGKVIFSDDIAVKTKIINTNPLVKSIYSTPENPIFEIFYIEHGQAVLSDLSGKQPLIYTF